MPDDPSSGGFCGIFLEGLEEGKIVPGLFTRSGIGRATSISLRRNCRLEYRSIQHHVEVLKKNALVTSQGERYGLTYFLTPWLESNIGIFDEITKKLNISLKHHPNNLEQICNKLDNYVDILLEHKSRIFRLLG